MKLLFPRLRLQLPETDCSRFQIVKALGRPLICLYAVPVSSRSFQDEDGGQPELNNYVQIMYL